MTGDERSAKLHATMRHERLRTPLRFTDVDLPTIDHEVLSRVWAPQLMSELSSLLGQLGWALKGGRARGGWRGQADIDWKLDSTAVRRLGEPRPEEEEVKAPPDYLEHVLGVSTDTSDRAVAAARGR